MQIVKLLTFCNIYQEEKITTIAIHIYKDFIENKLKLSRKFFNSYTTYSHIRHFIV